MQSYEDMKRLLDSIAEDVAKAEGGNKAAGTRVRQAMQEIKNKAQDIRKEILDLRDQAAD
ncbi:MAG: histone H1 [Planctomycetota bacterium]